MRRKLQGLSAAILLLVAPCHEAQAFLAGGPLTVSTRAIVNPVEQSPQSGCTTTVEVSTYGTRTWQLSVGEATPGDGEGWTATGTGIRCDGNTRSDAANAADATGPPFLIADVSTVARVVRQMEDERVLAVSLAVSLQKVSGFDDAAKPIYEPSELQREFFFAEDGDVLVPLLVARGAEPDALGVHEVLVQLTVTAAARDEDAIYGAISVTPGIDQGEILLDGGVVRRVTANTDVLLRNVRVGWREVGVRDASGHVARRAVRVVANRTVLVDLGQDGGTPSAASAAFALEPLGKNAQGYEQYRRHNDGATVIRIPAGEFLMGNRNTERTPLEHKVYVSEFLIDRTGVTWGQYRHFAAATGIPLPLHDPYWGMHDDHPAVYVTWEEARAYCEWAGGRLPTEAEREKAARGTDERKYPWGNEEPDATRGVHRRFWGKEATAAVGTLPDGASPYGALDMGGNVWEWCADWYDDEYYANSPYRDPKGPALGRAHVVRGGSWDSRPSVLSASCRSWGHRGYRDGDFGFRCAMNPPR